MLLWQVVNCNFDIKNTLYAVCQVTVPDFYREKLKRKWREKSEEFLNIFPIHKSSHLF